MKKRVKDTPVCTEDFCDEFYNVYRKPIDWFFGERKEETVYIRDHETVKKIEELLLNNNSNITYLIGKAGIGKTTLIKNEYGLSDNTTVFDEKRKIIFTSLGFRGKFIEGNLTDFIAKSISSLCDSLEEKFSIGESFYSENGQILFYDFIKETFASILGYAKKTELIGKNATQIKLYKLNKAEEYDSFSYEASRLKFYLLNYSNYYQKIVFVIDNMEVLDENLRIQLVRNMLSLFSCLLNIPGYQKKKMPAVDLLLSMRNTTFINLIKVKQIAAYHPIVVIRQNNPIDIFAYLEKKNSEVKYDKQDEMGIWMEMYEIIQNFTRKFSNKYSTMIKNLSNYDFTLEKQIYKKIFTNKVWLLRGNRKKDFLNMSKTDTLFNNISVIRAIACGNNAVYRGNKSKIIPNILLNDEIHDDSIVSLLTLAYFVRNDASVTLQQLLIVFSDIFNDDVTQKSLTRVIKHFLSTEILEKQISDSEDQQEKLISLTPRGRELWDMLTSDSVLLEQYREDHFIDEKIPDINFTSSYDFMSSIGQYAIFIQLFIYIDILLKSEKKIRKVAFSNGKMDDYYNCFGAKLQTKRLLDGVLKSVEYSGNMNAYGIDEKVWRLKEKMKDID